MITDELSLGKFGKVWGSPVSATSKDLTRLCRATCYKFESAAKSESLSGDRVFLLSPAVHGWESESLNFKKAVHRHCWSVLAKLAHG